MQSSTSASLSLSQRMKKKRKKNKTEIKLNTIYVARTIARVAFKKKDFSGVEEIAFLKQCHPLFLYVYCPC